MFRLQQINPINAVAYKICVISAGLRVQLSNIYINELLVILIFEIIFEVHRYTLKYKAHMTLIF